MLALCTAIFAVFSVLIAHLTGAAFIVAIGVFIHRIGGKRQQITIFQQWRHPLFAIFDQTFHRFIFGYYGTGPAAKARVSTRRGTFVDHQRTLTLCGRVHIQRPQRTVISTPRAFPFVDILRSIAERAAQQFPDVFYIPGINRGIDKRICQCGMPGQA